MPYEVYLIYSSALDAYKVGVSKNVERRLSQLQTASSCVLEIRGRFATDKPFRLERALHAAYAGHKWDSPLDRLSGEWFKLPVSEAAGFKEKCLKIEETARFLAESGNPFV